jgi:hypothetical protein
LNNEKNARNGPEMLNTTVKDAFNADIVSQISVKRTLEQIVGFTEIRIAKNIELGL